MRHLRLLALGTCISASMPVVLAAQDDGEAPPEVATITNEVFRGELVLRVGGGRLNYIEEATIEDVKSETDANTFDVGFRYTYEDATGFKLRATLDVWGAQSATEEWRLAGQLVQKNDMEVSGLGLNGAFGLDLLRASPSELNLWLGLEYRYQGFERSRFRFFGEEADTEGSTATIDEDYMMGLFTVGVDGHVPVSTTLTLGGGIVLGSAFYNEADNSALGSITGDGGKTLDLHAFIQHALSGRDAVGLGFRYGFQELDGDVQQSLIITDEGLAQAVSEWPDNELERITGELFWVRAL